MSIQMNIWTFLAAVIISATIGGMGATLMAKPRAMPQGEVTREELEKTKLILDFAERNCKKLGFRVEGSGAFVPITCGGQK